MKPVFVLVLSLLLVPLFGALTIAQVSSSASASASSEGPMEVTIGTFDFVTGDSLALEIVRDKDCACMCDPISVTRFYLENTDGPIAVKLMNDADLPLSIDKWVGMMSLTSPEGEALSAGKYTAVVETSAGTFKAQIKVADVGVAASSWGRVSSSASICGIEIRLYRLLTKETARQIDLRVGDRLMIALAGNATTGYAWEQITGEDTSFLSPVAGLDYQPQSTAAGTVGGGGTYFFRYTANGTGEGDLKFTYRRPWEKGPGSETIAFHIAVH